MGFHGIDDPLGIPMFVADFDLLTTVDSALQNKLRRWAQRLGVERFLTVRTLFVGTTVTEYALLNTDEPVSALQRIVERYARQYLFIIIKDLPVVSPLLADSENALTSAWLQAGKSLGWVELDGQALAWVPVAPGNDEAYWMQQFSRSRRKDFRRKLRSREQLLIREVRSGDACFQSEVLLREWYTLYQAVYAQSEMHFDLLTPEFFKQILQQDSGAVIFVYEQADQLIGYNLCFEQDGLLIDKYIGLRYPQAQQLNLYFVSWFHNLAYAEKKGLRAYVAGWTDPDVKLSLGASFSLTRHLVYIRPFWLRWILKPLRVLFESDAQVMAVQERPGAV